MTTKIITFVCGVLFVIILMHVCLYIDDTYQELVAQYEEERKRREGIADEESQIMGQGGAVRNL